jgi:ribosomal 50S subunit-associated protein YjgA (DUF615 family)
MDERLEAVSEKIRMGIPVSMTEAIEAIDYQQKLKTERDAQRSKTIIGRLMRWSCLSRQRTLWPWVKW